MISVRTSSADCYWQLKSLQGRGTEGIQKNDVHHDCLAVMAIVRSVMGGEGMNAVGEDATRKTERKFWNVVIERGTG